MAQAAEIGWRPRIPLPEVMASPCLVASQLAAFPSGFRQHLPSSFTFALGSDQINSGASFHSSGFCVLGFCFLTQSLNRQRNLGFSFLCRETVLERRLCVPWKASDRRGRTDHGLKQSFIHRAFWGWLSLSLSLSLSLCVCVCV